MLRCLVVAAFFFASCVPMAFRPARALPQGEFEHTIGVSAMRLPSDSCGDLCFDGRPDVTLPGASYTLRYGATSGVDVGVGFATLSALSLDATVQLVRTRFFDLAVGPTFLWEFSGEFPMFSTPVLADFNLGSAASFVGFAGPVAYLAYRQDDSREVRWLVQAGAGLELRPVSWFSFRPYVALLGPSLSESSREDQPVVLYGLGLAFGGQRQFR